MEGIKIIALDLDGTLLDSEKRLSEENRRALEQAADKGIEIVPTTGRIYAIIPEVVRQLPFINYAITVNGAELYDVRNDRVLAKNELPYPISLILQIGFQLRHRRTAFGINLLKVVTCQVIPDFI